MTTHATQFCAQLLADGRPCDAVEARHAGGELGHAFIPPPAGEGPPLWLDDQAPEQEQEQERAPRTWIPQDLRSVLDGTYQAPQPTVGRRDDGVGLFYPGRISSVASESEAGKTWFALIACLQEINDGNHVVYVDFEDDAGGVVGRLLVLGAIPSMILERFHYIRPEARPGPVDEVDLAGVLQLSPTLAIVDGVTEAMSMFGLELKDNTDVATFGRHLLRPLASTGAGVVTLDHVVKGAESRGRYSLGGVHKLNGLNGVMYQLENIRSFGIGVTGKSRVLIAKDRPAQLRKHGLLQKSGMHWFADLVIKSYDDQFAEGHLYPPIARDDEGETAEETKEQDRQKQASEKVERSVLRALQEVTEPQSTTAVEGLVQHKATDVRRALAALVAKGAVTVVDGPRRAKLHAIATPSHSVPLRPDPVPDGVGPRPATPSPSPSPLKEGDGDGDGVGSTGTGVTPGTESLTLGTLGWFLYSAPADPGSCRECGHHGDLYKLPFPGTRMSFCTACLPDRYRKSNNMAATPLCARCGASMADKAQLTHPDCKEPS